MKDRTVLQAKRYGVFSCTGATTIAEAARVMAGEDVSCLVVVDDAGYLEGVITRTDLLRARSEGEDWATKAVKDYMTEDVVTVEPEDRLNRVADLLLDQHIHRVVVVQKEDGRRRPVAVISAADIVYDMAKAAPV